MMRGRAPSASERHAHGAIVALLGTGLMLCLPSPTRAQTDRAAVVERVRNELFGAEGIEPLFEAMNPEVAPLDRSWAVATYDFAQILQLDVEQPELAATLLRWAARLGPEWPIGDVDDEGWYHEDVVGAYVAASALVQGGPAGANDDVATTWRWTDAFDAAAEGRVEVEGPSGVRVAVEGQAGGAGALTLPPGTYNLVVSADGYEDLRVQREVLPGVTTVLGVTMAPVLSPTASSLVARSLVQLRYGRGGAAVCTNGLAWGDGLVVTALSSLPSTTGLDVVSPDGTAVGVDVAESDAGSDLAVLHVGGARGPERAAAAVGDFAWVVFRDACGTDPRSSRGRVAGTGGSLAVAPAPPGAAAGAPLVDRTGELLGLVVGSGRVAPLSRAEELVEQALGQIEGGGFPLVWVGVGAAVVGGAAAFLMGGGGDEPPPPSTGGIVIQIPSG